MDQKIASGYRSLYFSFVILHDFTTFYMSNPLRLSVRPHFFCFRQKARPQIFWSCPFMIWSIFIDIGVPGGLLYWCFFLFMVGFKSGRCSTIDFFVISKYIHISPRGQAHNAVKLCILWTMSFMGFCTNCDGYPACKHRQTGTSHRMLGNRFSADVPELKPISNIVY